MHLQTQNGVVSTINFVPYFEIDWCQDLRKSLFSEAKLISEFSPSKHVDVFDETIMVFENYSQALHFLVNVFRAAVKMKKLSGINFSLKSSLCGGEYFVQDDQIYGDAVNLATKLSCSSRENELLVWGIDRAIIDKYIDGQHDVNYFVRSQDENCISIGLLDQDVTETKAENKILELRYNDQFVDLGNSPRRKINIGRADNSDIFIDSDCISRHHATITRNRDKIFITDHSSNGTYLYFDDREIFLTNESMELVSGGYIVCGTAMPSKKSSSDVISYQLYGENSVDSREAV